MGSSLSLIHIYADFHRSQIVDLIDFQLGIQLAAFLQDGAYLVGGDGVDAAAEGYQLHQLHVRLGDNVAGGVVQPAVIGPLIEHMHRLGLGQMGYRVLRHHHQTEGGDHAVDTVIDLRIDVIRTAGQHNNPAAFFPGLGLSLIHISSRSDKSTST